MAVFIHPTRLQILEKFAEALNVNLDWLLTGEGEMFKEQEDKQIKNYEKQIKDYEKQIKDYENKILVKDLRTKDLEARIEDKERHIKTLERYIESLEQKAAPNSKAS